MATSRSRRACPCALGRERHPKASQAQLIAQGYVPGLCLYLQSLTRTLFNTRPYRTVNSVITVPGITLSTVSVRFQASWYEYPRRASRLTCVDRPALAVLYEYQCIVAGAIEHCALSV